MEKGDIYLNVSSINYLSSSHTPKKKCKSALFYSHVHLLSHSHRIGIPNTKNKEVKERKPKKQY